MGERRKASTIGLGVALLAVGAVIVPASSGCDATLTQDVRNCDIPALFAANCAGSTCHSSENPQGGLDLTSPGVDQRLFHVNSSSACGNEKLVDPGHANRSLLFEKVSESSPSCGDRMPPTRPLSDKELQCLQSYIERAGIDTMGSNCETCGGILCVDFNRDTEHCGGCGQRCEDGKVCGEGQCINPCDETETLCGASCVVPETDDDHCGTCGHRCGPGSSCEQGVCRCDEDGANVGGAGGEVSVSTEPPSFAADILPLFENSCSGSDCHTGDERLAPLGLDPGDAYDHLIDVTADGCERARLVVPGSPDQSYLIDKLVGGSLCSGDQMPLAADPLPNAATRSVVRWICDGAPNN